MLLIMGSNPVYDAPADFGFADAMDKVPLRVQHGLYATRPAQHCHWHINGTHYLEQWGDVRAFDGTVSLIQPLIAPLYNGKSEYEFISALVGSSETARLRHRSRILAGPGQGRLRHDVAQGAERRLPAEYGVAGEDGRSQGRQHSADQPRSGRS